jgi:hypothetical protein
MPRVRRLGLTFGDADPVEVAWELLALEGLNDPEDLRGLYPLPKQPLICRVDSTLAVVDVGQYPRRGVLEDALWLGLCTNWAFDPSRPVFWTATSLTRRLEVFAGDGFYT